MPWWHYAERPEAFPATGPGWYAGGMIAALVVLLLLVLVVSSETTETSS